MIATFPRKQGKARIGEHGSADASESSFLGVPGAPTLGVDRFARKQLAWAKRRGRTLEEVAVRAGLTGLMRRTGLACIFGVIERLGGGVIGRQVRQIIGKRDSRQHIGEHGSTEHATGTGEKAATAGIEFDNQFIFIFFHKYTFAG
jgi:hypothetical protein